MIHQTRTIPFSIIFLLFLIILGVTVTVAAAVRRGIRVPAQSCQCQDLQALADTDSRSNIIIPGDSESDRGGIISRGTPTPSPSRTVGPWRPGELQVAAQTRNLKPTQAGKCQVGYDQTHVETCQSSISNTNTRARYRYMTTGYPSRPGHHES